MLRYTQRDDNDHRRKHSDCQLVFVYMLVTILATDSMDGRMLSMMNFELISHYVRGSRAANAESHPLDKDRARVDLLTPRPGCVTLCTAHEIIGYPVLLLGGAIEAANVTNRWGRCIETPLQPKSDDQVLAWGRLEHTQTRR